MTTTVAVAASGSSHRSFSGGWQWRARLAGIAGAALIGAALSACGSSNLLGNSDGPIQSATPVPASMPAPAPASRSRVGLAPIMGTPETVSKQVGDQLGSALERQRVAVSPVSDKPDYTLRGYMVATRERAATKISYIFDLTDPAGKRVNRIQGEEMAQGGDARDPWTAVTPEVSQRISDKAASSLASALSSLSSGGTGTGTGTGTSDTIAPSAPPVGVGASTAMPPAAAPAVAAAGPTTGSINSGQPSAGPTAFVPEVTGAPGDGNASLSTAMRQEMQQAGIAAAGPGQRSYAIAGKVTAGAVKDGKQSIKIDWRVTDPGGTLLATVSQNNDIQAGALDKQWGSIANDAAQGAATRIKQLIDENQASAGASRTGARTATRTKG